MIIDADMLKNSPASGKQMPMTKMGMIDKRTKHHKNGQAFLNGKKGKQLLAKPAPSTVHVQEAYKRQQGAAHIADFIKKGT